MAKFECDWCGKCCRSFGAFISVERQLTARDYYCRYGITNEVFPVHVQPEYADIIADAFEAAGSARKDAPASQCIFLVKNPSGKGFACAIYPTRPAVCRNFRCYRMLIYHQPDGEFRGRVMGVNELKTADPALRALWDEKIAHLPHRMHNHHHAGQSPCHSDDPEWIDAVMGVLAANGYTGDPVED